MKNETCQYNMLAVPENLVPLSEAELKDRPLRKAMPGKLLWSNTLPVPAIGDAVRINFNQLGTGLVESYFTEHGYFGLTVKLDNPPDWHRKQTKGEKYEGRALVFGIEVERI